MKVSRGKLVRFTRAAIVMPRPFVCEESFNEYIYNLRLNGDGEDIHIKTVTVQDIGIVLERDTPVAKVLVSGGVIGWVEESSLQDF